MPGGTLGGSPPRGPTAVQALLLAAAAAAVAAAAPGALAEGEVNLPPQETGLGPGDVDDEPSQAGDANGFPHPDYSPVADPQLVLDAHYLYEPFPFDLDVNNLVDEVSEGAGLGSAEKHMYPGFGYFEAWWGWWLDKGRNARTSPHHPEGDGAPDGAIQDAHDDPGSWGSSARDLAGVHHGSWDEFVWRGDNPWAGDPAHPLSSAEAAIEPHPDDRMLLFVDPGTHQRHARQMVLPGNPNSAYILRNDKDPATVPDMAYADHTAQGPYSAPGVPNDGGWDMVNHYPTGTYDAGMLITTRAETSVNPAGSGPRYDPQDAEAYDVDLYTALSPQVETLYRTAVWDPPRDHGDAEDEENLYPFHDQGIKQHVVDTFTGVWIAGPGAAADPADQATDPAAPAAGVADDAAGRKAWRHEPNRPGDAYGVGVDPLWATHDPATTYGALAGDSNAYYEPGPDQAYDGYQQAEHAWLDAQAAWGVPIYGVQFRLFGTFNLRTVQSPDGLAGGGDAPGTPPGVLGVSAHFGTWHDGNGDTWVGNVDEQGRWSSSQDPYNHGLGDPTDVPDDPFYQTRGDDPNDYTDTSSSTASDPTKQDLAEWRPLCDGGGAATATLVPRTEGQRWGEAGVYVLRDDEGRSNPYDDAVADAAGELSGDGDPRSRHRAQGPVDVELVCREDATGLHVGDAWVVSPTGTASYPVEVTAVGEVTAGRTSDHGVNQGRSLQGETVQDVDVLGSLQGE